MPLKYLRYSINDITTDVQDPPQYKVGPGSKPYNIHHFQIQQRLHPEIQALKTSLPPESVFAAAKDLAHRLPRWRVTYVDELSLHLEATSTTPMMRFKDDIIIEVRACNSGSEVHMRSRSRMGQSDFGKNATRITEFLKDLKDILSALS